jgi:hypothetical protein
MKSLTLSILLLNSIASFAQDSTPNQVLYESLIIKAVDTRPPGTVGATYLEKSIGGLICSVTRVVYPGAKPEYDCRFDKKVAPNYQAIYDALDAKEVNPRDKSSDGSSYKQKFVGGLLCSVTQTVTPDAKRAYNCVWRRTGLILSGDTKRYVSQRKTKASQSSTQSNTTKDGESTLPTRTAH